MKVASDKNLRKTLHWRSFLHKLKFITQTSLKKKKGKKMVIVTVNCTRDFKNKNDFP